MNIFGKDEEEPQVTNTRVISNSLGIDLGTLNTVIAKPSGDKFDLYQIPSVVAVKKDDPSEVLAVGEEAKRMLGRTPEDILAVRPLKKGVIENVAQAQALLIKAMQIGINEGTINYAALSDIIERFYFPNKKEYSNIDIRNVRDTVKEKMNALAEYDPNYITKTLGLKELALIFYVFDKESNYNKACKIIDDLLKSDDFKQLKVYKINKALFNSIENLIK